MRSRRGGVSRTRWAAIGAAVVVSLGGGVVLVARAADPPTPTSFIPIAPCRLMDTRPAPLDNVGPRATPLGARETYAATVWGTNGNCTIPSTAQAVSLNVTVVGPSFRSFLTVFPSDAARPNASNLNFVAGQVVPNAVTAKLSADGKVSFYNNAGAVHVIADIAGYYVPVGASAPDPAQVVWVATSGGDYTSLKAALASISDNSVSKPYVIKVAPGIYTESGTLDLKDYVDVEGSGQDVTTITCACGSPLAADGSVLRVIGPGVRTEVRDLTAINTGSGGTGFSTAIFARSTSAGEVSLRDVTVIASGESVNTGLLNHLESSPTVNDLTATASGGVFSYGVYNRQSSAPVMNHVTATASGAENANVAVTNESASSATINDLTATASGTEAYGMDVSASSPKITNSTITGATHSIRATSGPIVYVADSTLDGPIFGTTFVCVGVRTALFVALSPFCT